MLRLSGKEIFDIADKAVRSYVLRVFPGFFRDEDLEQVVIDVATSVWQKSDMYDETRAQVFTWVSKIAKNAVLDAVAAHIDLAYDIAAEDGRCARREIKEHLAAAFLGS